MVFFLVNVRFWQAVTCGFLHFINYYFIGPKQWHSTNLVFYYFLRKFSSHWFPHQKPNSIFLLALGLLQKIIKLICTYFNHDNHHDWWSLNMFAESKKLYTGYKWSHMTSASPPFSFHQRFQSLFKNIFPESSVVYRVYKAISE